MLAQSRHDPAQVTCLEVAQVVQAGEEPGVAEKLPKQCQFPCISGTSQSGCRALQSVAVC